MENQLKKVASFVSTGKVDKKAEDDKAFSAMLDRYWSAAEAGRKQIDWKWFNYDLWVSGHHYAKWDRGSKQIVSNATSIKDDKPRVVINKVFTTLRGVRSWVLQSRPKAEVTPYNMTEEDIDSANTTNQYLDYLHDKLGFRQKLRASLWHALKYSVGYWQVLFDDEDVEGGEIVVNVIDPYDLYWDPAARVPKEARYVILGVRRNIEDLKEDPKYKDADWELVKPDQQMSSSSLKSRILEFEQGNATSFSDNGTKTGTVIVKEYWYKEDKKIMLCTKAGDTIIRQPFDTGLTRFPFFRLCSDIEPLSMFGTGWVKNLIPANRLLNMLESSAAEYNMVVNKGRMVADKGAGVRTITNKHGNIIEKKKGFELNALPIAPLSHTLDSQIINANRYIEDIGALHDASMGRQSSSDQSGRSIEALQEGDSNNLSELVENTEEFLEDVYEYILYLASQHYQFARNITATTQTGQREFIQIIGSGAQDDAKVPGATVIAEKNLVDVKITSHLAYSAQGRREAMRDLVSLVPDLPPEYILQAYAIGPVADIVKKLKEQQEEKRQQEMQMQQNETQGEIAKTEAQGATNVAVEQAKQQMNAPTPAGVKEAIAFIRMLLNGQKPVLPKVVGPDFLQYLDKFIASPEAQQMGGELLSVLQTERDQAALHMQPGAAPVTN